METNNHFDAIVVGAGPAGLTAGIYLSRARFRTLILNEGTVGGQMNLTHEIANYPGVENISGYQLANIMKKQAKTFGCEIKSNIAIASMQLEGDRKTITLEDGKAFTANVVILTPGGRSRSLGVPGESQFKGRGVSYCATCDGDFFTDKQIVVVGGGNSALEETVSLTKYVTKATIVHQFDHFQAFEYAIEEAVSNPKIDVVLESTIAEFYGGDRLEGVMIKDTKTGALRKFATDGVFIFIGYVPNTEFLAGKVHLNQWKEIVVDTEMATNVSGVFAAGDSIAKRYRQITTSIGEATVAALAASAYLQKVKKTQSIES